MKKREIYVLIIILIVLIVMYILFFKSPKIIECKVDSDCIPASCCHPDSCVSYEQKPDCTSVLCSMSCEGPLDCGAGSCGCKKNKCVVVPNEN